MVRVSCLAGLCCCFIACVVVAETAEVYKYVDERGTVVYSQTPPASGAPAEELELTPGPGAAEQAAARTREQRLQEAAEAVDQAQARRAARSLRHQEELAVAREKVVAAEEALAESRIRHRNDYRDRQERNRLKKGYYDRVRLHEQKLREAQEELERVEAAIR